MSSHVLAPIRWLLRRRRQRAQRRLEAAQLNRAIFGERRQREKANGKGRFDETLSRPPREPS